MRYVKYVWNERIASKTQPAIMHSFKRAQGIHPYQSRRWPPRSIGWSSLEARWNQSSRRRRHFASANQSCPGDSYQDDITSPVKKRIYNSSSFASVWVFIILQCIKLHMSFIHPPGPNLIRAGAAWRFDPRRESGREARASVTLWGKSPSCPKSTSAALLFAGWTA